MYLLAILAYYHSIINSGQYTQAQLKDYAALEATINNVSVEETLHIINAESGYNPQAIGDHGTSIGMVQIHLPAHPDITRTQALNPIFSVEFLVNELKEGKGSQWSTYDSTIN